MELAEILNYVLGGTSILGLVGMIIYRKQNKSLKDSEAKQAESTAKQSSIETQRQEIELADLYKEKMLEMMELINVKQDKGNMNQDKMIQMLGSLDTRVDSLEVRMGKMEAKVDNIDDYLDGGLDEYIEGNKKQNKNSKNTQK